MCDESTKYILVLIISFYEELFGSSRTDLCFVASVRVVNIIKGCIHISNHCRINDCSSNTSKAD